MSPWTIRSWRTVLSETRMNAHSHSEENNVACVRVIHKASKEIRIQNGASALSHRVRQIQLNDAEW